MLKGSKMLEKTKEKIRLTKQLHPYHHTEEQRKKISEAMSGHKFSLERNKNIGIILKEKWKLPEFRNKMINKKKNVHFSQMALEHMKVANQKRLLGKKMEEIYGINEVQQIKKAISEKLKGKTYEEILGSKEKANNRKRKMSNSMIGKNTGPRQEYVKQKIRQKRLLQIFPKQDTIPELKVQQLLTFNNIPFTTHKPILGQPDIFIEPNLCIFIDGCYWHNCTQCFDQNKFTSYQRAKIIKDNIITETLTNQGYIVLRFYEHEINKNIDYVLFKIKNVINVIKI